MADLFRPGFDRNVLESLAQENQCQQCFLGQHERCDDVEAYKGMSMEDPYYLKPTCACYKINSTRHWEGEDMPEEVWGPESVPTKQRPGDQPLPQGGQRCVQDFIIQAMEESKQLGTERYGSPLRTFNGRNTLRDALEEARDLFVYLTQLQMEAQASHEELAQAVFAALKDLHKENFLFGLTGTDHLREDEEVQRLEYVAYWIAERLRPTLRNPQ